MMDSLNESERSTHAPKEKYKNDGSFKQNPKLFLTAERISSRPTLSPRASLSVCMNAESMQRILRENNDCPLYFTDAQALLTAVAFPQYHGNYPRWCRVVRPTKIDRVLVLLCDGVTKQDVDVWEKETSQYFVPTSLEVSISMASPHSYGCSPENELVSVPLQFLSRIARDRTMKHLSILTGCRVSEAEDSSDKSRLTNDAPPADQPKKDKQDLNTVLVNDSSRWRISNWQKDRYPRTLLLLGASQLSREHYPLPGNSSSLDFLATKDTYDDVNDRSPIIAVDCEMVMTRSERPMELARITLVNEELEVIYDTLVKPHNDIVNYMTAKSGITAKLLKNIDKRLKDVQMDLMALLPPDAILIGQSLNSDLNAMQMFHPYCIDTSVIFNLSGVRGQKVSLKLLASKFLNEIIQCSRQGHSSAEDASACMKLVQLKLRKSLEFGDVASGGWNVAELHSDEEDDGKPEVKRPRVEVDKPPAKQSVQKVTLSGPDSDEDSSSENEGLPQHDEMALSSPLRRHKRFLSVHGTAPWCVPLTKLLTESNVSTALLDRKGEAETVFTPEAISSLTSLITSQKDKRRVKVLPDVLAQHKWVFLRLYQRVDKSEKRISRISKLQRHIVKSFEALPVRSMMMVLCCGHPDRPSESAFCYSGLKSVPLNDCH